MELFFKKCISSIYHEEIESQNRNINLIENERLRIMNNKNMELYLKEVKYQKLLQSHQKLHNKLVKLQIDYKNIVNKKEEKIEDLMIKETAS